MNDELLALYNADREERIDQPRMGTPEYAMTLFKAGDRNAGRTQAIHLATRTERIDIEQFFY